MADNLGDHYVISDLSGRKILASKSRKQWNGMIVADDEWEPRHQLDLIRARRERPGVRNPRPEPADTFIGPITTTVATAAIAGATTLVVASTAEMEAGDRLSIMMDNGDTARIQILVVVDSTTLTLVTALRGTVSVGKMVYDNTAIITPNIG